MRWNGSYEQLRDYLRRFGNMAGEVVPYDTNGVLHLLLALADNLRESALAADLSEIVPEAVSAEQAAFFGDLAQLANQRGQAKPDDTANRTCD
jgi:hypothetical protein